jgi:hypothetical protein
MSSRSPDPERPTVKIPVDEPVPQGRSQATPAWGSGQINASAAFGAGTGSLAQVESIVPDRANDDWRRWIAENLLVGQRPESVIETMIARGFSTQEAMHEVRSALISPYVRGAQLLLERLKKRDWLLAVYRKSRRLDRQSSEIDRRHRLSRAEFLSEYYALNRPVVITGMMDDWPAMRTWNLDYFSRVFGDREVEVQMGRLAAANYEIESQKHVGKIRFGEFIEKVRAAGETNDFYLTANNNSSNRRALAELWDDIIQIPEYLAAETPGGFLWIGPKGTVTPFHHDLTNNFMAQVIGQKRVKIAPSWDLPLMRNHLHCFSQVDGRSLTQVPHAPLGEPQIDEVVIGPGEILFLPIGCFHYVHGIEISITVSFTNFVFDNDFSSFYTTYGPV